MDCIQMYMLLNKTYCHKYEESRDQGSLTLELIRLNCSCSCPMYIIYAPRFIVKLKTTVTVMATPTLTFTGKSPGTPPGQFGQRHLYPSFFSCIRFKLHRKNDAKKCQHFVV